MGRFLNNLGRWLWFSILAALEDREDAITEAQNYDCTCKRCDPFYVD